MFVHSLAVQEVFETVVAGEFWSVGVMCSHVLHEDAWLEEELIADWTSFVLCVSHSSFFHHGTVIGNRFV
jgi:hypothetical protein